jgi:hypothetical protein
MSVCGEAKPIYNLPSGLYIGACHCHIILKTPNNSLDIMFPHNGMTVQLPICIGNVKPGLEGACTRILGMFNVSRRPENRFLGGELAG